MKKIFFIFALLFTLGITSCGSKPSVEDVEKKIENNQELDKADYECMINYILDHIKSEKEFASLNEKEELRFSNFLMEIIIMPEELKQKDLKKKYDELDKKMEELKSTMVPKFETNEVWVADDDEDTMVEVAVEEGDEPIGY